MLPSYVSQLDTISGVGHGFRAPPVTYINIVGLIGLCCGWTFSGGRGKSTEHKLDPAGETHLVESMQERSLRWHERQQLLTFVFGYSSRFGNLPFPYVLV